LPSHLPAVKFFQKQGVFVKPRKVLEKWVDAFNSGDAKAISGLYHEKAVNYQVPELPVEGKDRIEEMFATEFSRAKITCIVENIFEDAEYTLETSLGGSQG